MKTTNSWIRLRRFQKKVTRVFFSTELEYILTDLLSQDLTSAPLPEKMEWLEQILFWFFQSESNEIDARFRFFFQVLDKNPEWQKNFQATFLSLLGENSFLNLYTQIGIAVEHGLWSDIAGRFIEQLLPQRRTGDFQDIVLRVFNSPKKINQLLSISDETLLKIRTLAMPPESVATWGKVQNQSSEALLLLSSHVVHYGVSADIRARLPTGDLISESSFFKLISFFSNQQENQLEPLLLACENDVAKVYQSLEINGVSVDVVNRLEVISALLQRIRLVNQLKIHEDSLQKNIRIRSFLEATVINGLQSHAILGHIKRHFYLLSRKIVERNGNSGDHYIARNSAEFRALFTSALGGGFIVVVMTILKTRLILLQPAPFFLALGIWIIYAMGFLSMQFMGATLATKIPSFTASRLAGLLQSVRKSNADEFHTEFKLVLKSQGVALLGNLAGVIPLALLINYCLQQIFNQTGLMDEHYSHHSLHDINPILSFSVFLGALTGVQLWFSSIVGGWFENWVVFKQLPNTLRNHHRLRKFFGDQKAKQLAEWLLHHSSGVATNISLGFLFGFVPLFGTIFGANWNGNHVTISTAGASFAISSLNFNLSSWDWAASLIGLFLIAVMNFFVSFGLALWVASNAQNIRFSRAIYHLSAGFKKK